MRDSNFDPAQQLEFDLLRDVHAAYLSTARESLQRIVSRAERGSAIALGLLSAYTAWLALGGQIEWIAGTAAVPVLLFGLSAVAYGYFLAGVGSRGLDRKPLPLARTEAGRTNRLNEFVRWVNLTALRRAWVLQMAIALKVSGLFSAAASFIWPNSLPAQLLTFVPIGCWLCVSLVTSARARLFGSTD